MTCSWIVKRRPWCHTSFARPYCRAIAEVSDTAQGTGCLCDRPQAERVTAHSCVIAGMPSETITLQFGLPYTRFDVDRRQAMIRRPGVICNIRPEWVEICRKYSRSISLLEKAVEKHFYLL